MKGTALTLLCALALTQASQSQRNSDGTKICNCNPSEAQAICSDYASDGIQIAHENCNKFYQCFDGRPIPFTCPSNLMYNAELEICDWPQNVECGDRPISEEGSTGEDEECDEDNNDGDNNGSDGNNEDNSDTTCNCNPSEAPNICKNEDSDGVLVAHENCNQFYKCFDSAPVTIDCPLNLLFNPRLEICDWPEKVDCGDRVIPDGTEGSDNGGSDNGGTDNGGTDNGGTDNGGSDNGGSDNEGSDIENIGSGNCDPSEAPTICASEGSNGVLVAHENCNQFYICSYGKPVGMRCPGNLLFNPNTDRCDWPDKVDCGDRVIPDGTDNGGSDNGGTDNGGSDNGGSDNGGSDNGGSGNGGTDNGGSDNGGTDNGGSDNGGSDNGGNGNVGAGNCDPSEAPSICAAEGSDDVLVAHENCNQYYICSNGKPVALKCPGTLLFNPNTDQCDWPENVECGERVIPDDTDNGGADNGGNDNGGSDNGGSDNGGTDNGGSDNGGTDNGGSDNGGTDNGGSDNGGSDNGGNGNVGAGNCDPSEAPSICAAEGSDGVLVAHENCNQYYICSNGKPVALKCPGTLLFNPNTDQCDWPENVECGERVIPDDTDNGGTDNGGSDNGGSDNGGTDNGGSDNGGTDNGGSDNGGSDNGGNGNVGAGNCDPSEAPSICAAEGSDGVLVAHENCNQYYICSNGKPVALKCPGTLLFNPNTDQCDWPENVECGERVIPDDTDNGGTDNGGSDNGGSDNGGNDNGGTDNGGSDNGGTDNGGSDNGGSDNGGNGNVGAGNCDPSEAPSICAAEGSDGVLVAHENCNQYYICSNGKPVALKCPGTLLFNPNTDQCDWPENVECGERVIPDDTDNGGTDNGGSDNGGSDNGGNDNGGTDNGGSDNGGTDNGGSDNGGSDNGGNGNVGAGNCDPSEAPSICAAEGSDGVLVAHENCNQYYICSNGKPVALKCPGNLLFNPNTDQCDWPENVECGERVIPDDTDNGGTDNGGSDNGGSDNGGTDNGGTDNGGTDNGGSDNGGSDNGGNGNVGAGNCDPSEAPSICAAEGSDGVLVAHENCNQYYICSNGKPVALKCPGNLLFNPNTDQCDWPENVECGERVIPDDTDNGGTDNGGSDNGGSDNGGTDNGGSDNGGTDNGGSDNGGSDNGGNGNVGAGNCDPSEAPSICAAEGSDGVLVAHENCNQYYICSNGKPVALKCPGTLLFNPNTDQCDWSENVECGERVIPDDTDNGGSDNGGSDNGGSDNGGSDNGGTDNGGSDNGGTDNGGSDNGGSDNGGNGNEGAGNCDPSEAPSICAAEGSDGVLVAHENCNQYYICSNGKPVALKCPGTLLFNPNTDQCDWPENVECGERVIPDDTDNGGTDNGGSDNGGSDNGGSDNGGTDNGGSDNGGSDNGGSDNGGSDNGGSDNGGSDNGGTDNGGSDNGGSENGGNDNVGAGNYDPSEAPSICAAEGSDDVLVAHENCNQYYICSNGKPVALKCPGTLLFNPNTDQCDWPENVDCGERVIPDDTDNGGTDNGGSDNGGSDNGGSDNGGTDNGGSDNGGSDNGGSDNGGSDNGGTDNGGTDNGGTDNGGSDNGGSDNGGNGNVGAGNCDPSEAPSICAAEGSDGVLVAHENCNQFYKCFNGIPVALKCPGTLLFDPHMDQCDWPENVDCGERLIPDETDNGGNDNGGSDNGDSDNGGNDNGGSDNGDSENDSSDNGSSDNGGNDNNGGSGNTDPSEAPAICAADESNGILVAHENCNQFYKCSDGKPVALICPVNLLFNPKTDQCDWPEKVECGDRIIPDGTEDNDNGGGDNGGSDNSGSGSGGNSDPSEAGTICGSAGSDGVLVAHEKCNKFYMCADGIPVPILCSSNLLFNPSLGVCDWPRNVDCGDRIIPESDEACLCNARQAPSICSGERSDGLLIAHEYCNQYYVCVAGSPVARRCPLNHLYNPHEAACDWVQNVSCGDRKVPYSLNKHVDARQAIRF